MSLTRWVMCGAASLWLSACALDALDLDGKACPCVSGYVCDTPSGLCVRTAVGGSGGDADPVPGTETETWAGTETARCWPARAS